MSSSANRIDERVDAATPLLESAVHQLQEDSLLYNEAVGSFNTHLDNHRERRDLHDIPFREPISPGDEFSAVITGDAAAIEALIETLIDDAHLDSQVRRHPRTYPIHVNAVKHIRLAREQVVSTLEEAFAHAQHVDTSLSERPSK